MSTVRSFLVPEADAGARLDAWLEDQLSDCTRSLIARLIREGHCQIEPGVGKPGYKLRGAEHIQLTIPEPEQLRFDPEDIPLDVIYEDDHLLLIDKAPQMVVHPAPGHPCGTLINALLGRARGAWEPALIHRLDEDTSGLIAIAKTPQAHACCQQAFKERRVQKRYLALVHGRPRADVLENTAWIARHAKDFRKRCAVAPETRGAKQARTTLVVRERHEAYAVVEARPQTGRTHQVRVHLADLGHAVLADRAYSRQGSWPPPGVQGPVLTRQALHAWALDLPHPTGGLLCARAAIPLDLAPFIDACDLVPLGSEEAAGGARLVPETGP